MVCTESHPMPAVSPHRSSANADVCICVAAVCMQAWDHLTKTLGVDPTSIILYGQSIGTSPSTDKAARLAQAGVSFAGLILHSGMLSGIRILRPECKQTICIDPFQNIKKITRVTTAPTLVLHGRRDQIIPFEHAVQLVELCPQPVEPLFLSQATHDDIELSPK